MSKPKLLISRCLCGDNTKYNGGNNLIQQIQLIKDNFELIYICPEVMGGLTTPRNPSEIKDQKVLSSMGKDVTKEFVSGAKQALFLAQDHQVHYALLKEASPSCGVHRIYDGTFLGRKIEGSGITTQLLKKNGILVFSEHEIEELLKII